MSAYGLKIKNIKAGTLFGYNQGIRDRYDYTDAMFSNSLFSDFIRDNGMNVWKDKSTRDIICLDFDFGSRSYDEEIEHLNNTTSISEEKAKELIDKVKSKKDSYIKMSKEEIREHFYKYGVDVEYVTKDKEGNVKNKQTISYKMLYRSSAKAKIGQVMFINEKLYDRAYDWLTMGIGNKMDKDNAKIVEMSAYAPLTTSTIIGKIQIPIEDILILEDKDSFFNTITKVVKAEPYYKIVKEIDEEKTERNRQKAIRDGNFLEDGTPKYRRAYKKVQKPMKKCIVVDEKSDVKNTLWDGLALIESSFVPERINKGEFNEEKINGMILLRNHFFKTCAFKSKIQLFFKDWCKENSFDYETYEILDMFGIPHKLKDIKMITTDNSIKWKKFKNYMGKDLKEAYLYWCERIKNDDCYFGIVKTDHPSKLEEVQQMSYQMINTLPCTKEDIRELASTSVKYVESLKTDNDKFELFLRKNSTEVNHYEMLADLYKHNHEFANSTWFRYEKKKIINNYVNKLRNGKITINADNLTVCGNPYALLLYSVGEDWESDPTLNYEKGTIQCYTKRFNDGEYLCGIRNPHNSPNNVCYLHNVYTEQMNRYFDFSNNIIAVNCIKSDVQSRANGMDFDSDFLFVTNNIKMVECAEKCYKEYPTIVNDLKESGITYENTLEAYANMDNKFAKSRLGIGESSNLAQLAMTYYWTEPSKELYDNFVILSVLAQVIIDGCKREYEVDGVEEIKRIKNMPCMIRTKQVIKEEVKKDNDGNEIVVKKLANVKCDFPEFMKYTKEIKYTKNKKERPYKEIKEEKDKLKNRINKDFVCPMNWLEEILSEIQMSSTENSIPTENFFIKDTRRTDSRKISKIRSLLDEYDDFSRTVNYIDNDNEEELMLFYDELSKRFHKLVTDCQKIKTSNYNVINRLIETSLGIDSISNRYTKKGENSKYCRKMLNLLYNIDKDKFLSNFIKNV